MAYEIPNDLIQQFQISLRNAAGISSYDPHDPSLPNLPLLHASIAELDPSPPHLRCNHCRGRLLRDSESFICVFCGRELNSEVPPSPIHFNNTFACRWLLDSLHLDGSEMVGHIDLKASKQRKSPEQFPLTDLLDLEIRWPEPEKRGLSDEAPAPSKSGLNLAGVDFYYFSEENKDRTSKVWDEPIPLNKQIDGSESKIEDNVVCSLFGNVHSSEIATRITKHESGDSFSGWEANFQTANSGTTRDNSKSVDPFTVSGIDISSSLETTSGHQNKSRSEEIEETKNPSSSMTNDLCQQQDDSWSSSSHGIIRTPGQVDQTGILIDGMSVGTADYSSSATVDQFQVDPWQGVSKKKPDDISSFKDDDSADTWDDFTSSTGVQGSLGSSRKDVVNGVMPKVDGISEIDFFSTTSSKDSNFGNFSQPNLFAEAFPNPTGRSEGKATWPNASDLRRMSEENGKTGENFEAMNESQATSGPSSKSNDVQMAMAKMHDLSFMLEGQLSMPPK